MRRKISLPTLCGMGTVVSLCLGSAVKAQANFQVFPAASADTKVSSSAQRQPETLVTLNVRDSTVRYVINAVAQQAHLRSAYSSSPALAKRITVHVVDMRALDALAVALRGTGLTATLASDGETIVVRATSGRGQSHLQTGGTISGRVTDSANGRGLGGATVRVQGTTLAVVTTDSGQFVLRNVPVGDQIVTVRLFGHRPVTRTVTVTENGEVPLRISMVPTATVLGGMVTTATGTQRKLEVGNDITNLNVDSIMKVAPITNVTDLLESRVPGLTVLRSSGTPGDPSRLRLRGPGSINGNNDPIVIIDGIRVYAAQSETRTANLAGSQTTVAMGKNTGGVREKQYAAPSPLDQIDPSSIETIEVLKGPSATATYGSDAANGVIVITTKHGRAGPTRWMMNTSQAVSYLPGDYPINIVRWAHEPHDGGLRGSSQALGNNLSGPCDIAEPTCSVVDSVTHIQLLNEPHWSPFGLGQQSNGSLSVSGGTSTLTYSLTGSMGSNLGVLKLPDVMADAFQQVHGYTAPSWAKRPDRYTTWGGSGQLTSQVMPNVLQITLNNTLFHGLQQRSSLDDVANGLIAGIDTVTSWTTGLIGHDWERARSEQLTTNYALTASWTPWTWMPLTGVAGLNITTGNDKTLMPRFDTTNSGFKDVQQNYGRYGVAQKNTTIKTLNLNTTIPGLRGRLRTALGFNLYTQSTLDLTGHEDSLALGVSTPSVLRASATQSVTNTATYGWFFEPRFTLSERLFLTPGFRLDGGNANGGNASVSGLPAKLTFAALFPKLNLSWIALDRQDGDAVPLFGVLTLLRPRLAMGSAGVQPTPGAKLRLLQGFSSVGCCALTPSDTLRLMTLGNTKLRPERSFEVEGGIDAEAWHNRASLQLTHARKMQHDAIIPIPIALSVNGGGSVQFNIGDIRNTNTELSATIRPIETSLVSWTIGGNMSRNDNKVLKLDQNSTALFQDPFSSGGQSSLEVFSTKIAVGYPLFGHWARPILGYGDANGDGIIQRSEIRLGDTAVFLGRNDPAVTTAVNTDLALFHGRVGVHANFYHQGAYSQVNFGGEKTNTFFSVANEPGAALGQQANYVAATGNAPLTYAGVAQTVSYWRFQSFSINYVVPVGIAQRFRVPRMSMALQGSNLGLWTNYRGKDPNVNAFPNGNATVDGGQIPQPRTWSLLLMLGN